MGPLPGPVRPNRTGCVKTEVLRIVYVSWEYPPHFGGGIGTYVDAMSRILAGRGHAVTVLTVGALPVPQREQRHGVTVVRLPAVEPNPQGPVETLRSWQRRADAVAEVLGCLARGGVDVIEFCDLRGEGASYLHTVPAAERPLCVTRLHTPSCTVFKYNPAETRYGVLEEFELDAIRASDRIVSPSRAMIAELRERLGQPRSIDVSPLPLHPDFHAACMAEGDRPAEPLAGELAGLVDDRTVLYVGRLEQRKGVETLIATSGSFLRACPDARLVLVGGDTSRGPDAPSMRDWLVARIGEDVRARIHLHPAVPPAALRDLYSAARLCVFPSHFECFGYTCLEALALGKLVVVTHGTGLAEIVGDASCGLLVPPADADALADALTRAFRLPAEQRRAMEAAARERARRYAPDVIATELEALYSGYVASHPRRASAARPVARTDARVAVVVPCFNHGRFLVEAVRSALAQRDVRVECVVVDDGSTDETTQAVLDRLAGEGIRVIRQANGGLPAARNAGVRATDTAFFVPLDADDTLEPEFIARLQPRLSADSSLGYAYSQVRYFGASHGEWRCPPYDPLRLLVDNLSAATALVRRQAFDEVGGYSADLVHGFEDWDFWIALLAAGYHGVCVPEPLFNYRQHASGSMLTRTQQHRQEMLERLVARHRRLFEHALTLSLSRKDAMYFAAHLDAARLRHVLLERGALTAAAGDDPALAARLAEAELDYIRNSRLWRLVERGRRFSLGRLVLGPSEAAGGESSDPTDALRHLKASRAYRWIQALKATFIYRAYARRRYGPQTGQAGS